jgi:outer membrane scaffolding protein for murein synthesis (MipA/OmpV family)
MKLRRNLARLALGFAVLASGASAALANGSDAGGGAEADVGAQAANEAAEAQPAPAAPPAAPFNAVKPVFDETWATIGLGAGLVPSYAGSDNYVVFPLPLIVGRVGGVGIRPNGPGLTFDLLSPKPSFGPRKTRLAFGPAFRLRNDRNAQIEDGVVEAAGKLELALEAGLNAAISFPGVFKPLDSLTLGAQVRWDVLGAHEGMVIEPQVNYATPLGKAFLLQVQAGMEFVDDSFADYYFSVSPPQRAASGLPAFSAEGGLNRIGTLAILSYDLSGNALDGGWSLYGVGGYSRLLGDAADTPFTSLRGDANQFILGLGVGYTF